MTDDQIERVARAIHGIEDNADGIGTFDQIGPEVKRVLRDMAKRAIAAASEWLPIESAPKDGAPVLAFFPAADDDSRRMGAIWYVPQLEYWATDVIGRSAWEATHWQPLPQPPKVTP